MDKGTNDVLRLGGKKRRSNRRSSILKTRSPSRALSEIDPNAPLDDDVTINTKKNRHSRRVSFSATCQIKEFLKDGHWQAGNQAPAAQGAAQADKAPATQVSGLDLLLKGPIQDPVVGSPEETPGVTAIDPLVKTTDGQQTAPGARNVDSYIPPSTFSADPDQGPETSDVDRVQKQWAEQTADKTQHFDDDSGDMDMTTCMTKVISLNTTVTHPPPIKRRSIRGSADHTQIFGNNADMDFTTCDDVFGEDEPNNADKVDTMSALSRIMMAAPKQDSIEAGGTNMYAASNSGNRTIVQSADMDLTTCNSVVLDRFQTGKQLETSAALLRIMSGKKTQGAGGFEKTMLFSSNQGDMDMTECLTQHITLDGKQSQGPLGQAGGDKTQIFDSNADMEFTTCLTGTTDISYATNPDNKVDTLGALARIMSAPRQIKVEAKNADGLALENKALSNQTIVDNADMDFTQCNTAPISVPSSKTTGDRLETASVLSRIMSGKKSIPSQTTLEKTCVYEKGEDMEMTTCLSKTQMQVSEENRDNTVHNVHGGVERENKRLDHTVLDAADMDFTRCHTAAIEAVPTLDADDKLKTASALSRIMSGKNTAPTLDADDKLKTASALSRIMSGKNTAPTLDADDKLKTASALSRIMSGKNTAPTLDADDKLKTASALSRIMSGKNTAPTLDADDKLKTASALSRIMSGKNTAPTLDADDKLKTASALSRIMSGKNTAPTLDADDKLKTASALSRIMSEKNTAPTLDADDKLKTASALSRVMSGKNTAPSLDAEDELETSSALSRILSGKNITTQNVQVNSNAPQTDEHVQKVDSSNFLARPSGTKTICTPEDRNADKTKIFTEDGDSAVMDFTQCLTTNFTGSQQIQGQSHIASKSVMEKTCFFDGGEEMEFTTCLSKTQLEDFQEGKRDLEPRKESTEAQHRRLDRTTVEGADMDFTTCNTVTIEVPETLSTDKIEAASVLSRIMLGKNTTTNIVDSGSVPTIEPTKVDQTRIFTEDGDSAVMEFTQCLTSNFTQKDQIHSKSTMEKTCVFEKGEDMEFTACLSKTQLQEVQEAKEELTSKAASQMTTNEKISDQTVITDIDMDLTTCTNVTLKVSNGQSLPKSGVHSKRLDYTTVDTVDMDFTVCNTVRIEDPQQLNRDDKPETARVHSGEKSEALSTQLDSTKVFNTGEDMEMTACMMGPPLSMKNITALNEVKSFTERTRHYSQGSEDMEFTGQIEDVIVSGHALEQQQKENSVAHTKLSKRASVGLTVLTNEASTFAEDVPVVKPVRTGLTDVSHNFSTSNPGADMDLTSCPEKPIHQRVPSVSDTDSDQDILRPDDGVPIRLGAIIAPRITEDGCIYTQATFDKSLKFIGDIDRTGLFENQSRLETLVETSREASSACQSVSECTSVANLSSLEKTQASSQNQSTCPNESSSWKDPSETEQLNRFPTVHEPEVIPEHNGQPVDSTDRKESLLSANENHTLALEECVGQFTNRTNTIEAEVELVSNDMSVSAKTSEEVGVSKVNHSYQSGDSGENKTKLFNGNEAGDMEMTMCDGEVLSQDDHSETATSNQSHRSFATTGLEMLPNTGKVTDSVSLCEKRRDMHTSHGQNVSLGYIMPEEGLSTLPQEPTHMADPLANVKNGNSIYGEAFDMDLSLDGDFPATEDLIPISIRTSQSKKRHSSDDLENANCSQNESKVARITDGGPKDSVLERTEAINQTRSEVQSMLDGSKSFLKPVLSKPLGPVMSRSYGEQSIYNIPLMGTSSSQLSLIEMSHLDDVQPQTIDDYLELFNIRKVEARRNSTNVKALNLEQPTDTASILKQIFIDAPRLELLQAATVKLCDRKTSITETLDKVEVELMQDLPQIFRDVMTVSPEEKSAMVKKYRDMYKACSISTRAALKGVKCDFIKSLNLKYQEQVHVAGRLRGELLDKSELSSEVQQLIEEVHTEIQQDLQKFGLEECATPEQNQQLVTLNQKLEELQKLCEAKENDLRNVQRKILEASEKQKIHHDEFIDRLNMLIPKSYQGESKDQLRMTQRLCSWRTTHSSKEEHVASFIFDSLLLQCTFTSDDSCNTQSQLIKDITLTSKLADESADYAKLSHLFVLSTFDGEKLREKYQMENRLNDVLQDVAIQVAIASDLGVNVVDIGVVHKVQVEGFRITIGFVSLAAFAKFDLIVTIDPTTYPTQEPVWRLTSFIGSTSMADVEPYIRAVEPGLGYLYRIVSAVDRYLKSKEK